MGQRSKYRHQALFHLADTVQRPWVGILLFALLGFGGAASTGLIAGFYIPQVHDEYSYLLAADTFASGRITNSTHAMWKHFESFHIIHLPTYMSKYPPAQGLILALGQVVGGHPAVGVWISIALMCAALYWMLMAWLPVRWALLGGFLATLQFGIVGYWAYSYWGGAVAATGGALLYGSLRRIVNFPRYRDGVLLSFGLIILANSRPFEGLLVSVPAAAMLLYHLIRRREHWAPAFLKRTVLPSVLLLTAGAVGMGYYNQRVTKQPTRFPYEVYSRTYEQSALTSAWGTTRTHPPPSYRHKVIEQFHTEWRKIRERQRDDPSLLLWRLGDRTMFFFGFTGIALVMLPVMIRDPWLLFATATSAALFAISLPTAMFPHYLAPVAGLAMVVATKCLRTLYQKELPLIRGKWWVAAIIVASIGTSGHRLYSESTRELSDFQVRRSAIKSYLEQIDGKDLVLVRYGPNHNYHREYVYNRAQIDTAEIVWAREMSPSDNQRLIDYFGDRRAWLLVADENVRLQPFGPAMQSNTAVPHQ